MVHIATAGYWLKFFPPPSDVTDTLKVAVNVLFGVKDANDLAPLTVITKIDHVRTAGILQITRSDIKLPAAMATRGQCLEHCHDISQISVCLFQ